MNRREAAHPTVLVVGAGPTGLALACGLRNRGVSVRVVDQAGGPITTSRALGVQPRGVEVLLRLGALGDLPQQVIPLREVRMHVAGRLVSTMPIDRLGDSVGRSPLLVSQVEVESALRARLAELGGVLDWGRELVDCVQDGTGVTATLCGEDGTEPVRADWLAGCDGAHSRVRKLSGIGFPGVPVAEHFLIADVRTNWALDRQIMSSWSRGGEMVSVCPLPGTGRWRLMGPAPTGTEGRLTEDDVLTLIKRQLAACTPYSAQAIERVDWLSTFRIHRRLADSYRSGRVVLAGDAVAIHHPFGGQGMNTGLGDAENLAWKLALVANGRAGDRLLDSYQAERRPVAQGVLAGTGLTTRLVLAESRATAVLRDRLVMPLLNSRKAQEFIWRNASQLGVHYRDGPLAGRGRFAAGPRQGDRVPDIHCRLDGGAPVRLHQALDGRWGVLAGPGNEASFDAAAAWLGTTGVVALTPARGRTADVLLIRPDAHLAWRGRPAPERLSSWLGTHLEPSSGESGTA
ncbi:FAD-dependent monooxygenase [Amycolatopsis minnesotensis]|uniref:FAD-dependent monooxygenase n=1 Tax=Amycolatopsis minnesotensis TaxID=337894 RepID=A0ABN2QWZ2_9PSEU